tara:strand:- start:1329 stop:2039 length:711 start_codon:yes stop_codon:yes gene_type:complete
VSKTENYYLITGSSSGLGDALCKQLKQNGFKSLGIDKTAGIHTDINIDLSNISNENILEIKNFLNSKKIDSIVHCAAVQKNSSNDIDDISATFDEVFSVNVKSIYLLVKTLENEFSDFPKLCIVSSIHAKATTKDNTLYASSKSAIQGLVNGLTIEKNEKMSIFELILGAMDSPMLTDNLNKKEIQNLINELPSKKILEPDEVANFIIDLLNQHAKILHGSSITVDNGVLSKLPTK